MNVNISLRKTSSVLKQLATAIKTHTSQFHELSAVKIDDLSSPDIVKSTSIKLLTTMNNAMKLNEAMFAIRAQVQTLNKQVGIDIVLNDIETNKSLINILEYSIRNQQHEHLSYEVAMKAYESRKSATSLYGNSSIVSGVLSPEEVDKFKKSILTIKKNLSKSNDELLRLNLNTEIVLSPEMITLFDDTGIVL